MAMAAFVYMYDLDELTFEIVSFVVALVISTSGIYLAYVMFSKVASEYLNGFTLMNNSDENA